MEDAPYTATIKAGPAYDAPWIIVKAESAQQLSARLNALEDLYIPQTVSRVSKSLAAAYKHENEAR